MVSMCRKMRMGVNIVFAMCLVLCTTLQADEIADAKPRMFNSVIEVSCEPFNGEFVLGDPIALNYTLWNPNTSNRYVEVSFQGVQSGMHITVVDEQQQEVPQRRGIGGGPPGPIMFKDMYSAKPDEEIQLSVDLAKLFLITEPGRYTVTISYLGKQVCRSEVTLVALIPGDGVALSGVCKMPFRARLEEGAIGVECKVACGRMPEDAVGQGTVITLRDLIVKYRQHFHTDVTLRYKTPREATVAQAMVDYKWQVWIILKSGNAQTLVVGDLRGERIRTIIPWTTESIELGGTAASRMIVPEAKIAIAGIRGKKKISSQSEIWKD